MSSPSAVLRCIAAGSILVLYHSSVILYTLLCINEIAAAEVIKALNNLLAWTVTVRQSTVRQSEVSPSAKRVVNDCPIHLSESPSLPKEGSSSLKDRSHYLISKRGLKLRSKW